MGPLAGAMACALVGAVAVVEVVGVAAVLEFVGVVVVAEIAGVGVERFGFGRKKLATFSSGWGWWAAGGGAAAACGGTGGSCGRECGVPGISRRKG